MKIKSDIKSVSVYRKGAVISRMATLEIHPGENQFELDNIGVNIPLESVKISLDNGLICKNINAKPDFVKLSSNDLNRREKLYKEIRKLETEKEIKLKQVEFWENNADFTQRENTNLKDFENYMDAFSNNVLKLKSEITELERDIKSKTAEAGGIGRETPGTVITFSVFAEKEEESQMLIKYLEPAASWEHVYEIHADKDILRIKHRAKILQTTSSDWSNVEIALLTGRPNISHTIPQVKARRLNIRKNTKAVADTMCLMSEAPEAGMAMMRKSAVREFKNEPLPVNDVAEYSDSESMQEYELKGLWDIKSSTSGVMCDLSFRDIPFELKRVCVPASANHAFVAAEIDSNELGETNGKKVLMYMNDNFVGNVTVYRNIDSDKTLLSLGMDELIKVEREVSEFAASQLMNKKLVDEIKVTITSARKEPCKIQIMDTIPIAASKEITVNPLEFGGANYNKETSILTWNIDLPAQESKKIVFKYEIILPKKEELAVI